MNIAGRIQRDQPQQDEREESRGSPAGAQCDKIRYAETRSAIVPGSLKRKTMPALPYGKPNRPDSHDRRAADIHYSRADSPQTCRTYRNLDVPAGDDRVAPRHKAVDIRDMPHEHQRQRQAKQHRRRHHAPDGPRCGWPGCPARPPHCAAHAHTARQAQRARPGCRARSAQTGIFSPEAGSSGAVSPPEEVPFALARSITVPEATSSHA